MNAYNKDIPVHYNTMDVDSLYKMKMEASTMGMRAALGTPYTTEALTRKHIPRKFDIPDESPSLFEIMGLQTGCSGCGDGFAADTHKSISSGKCIGPRCITDSLTRDSGGNHPDYEEYRRKASAIINLETGRPPRGMSMTEYIRERALRMIPVTI